MNRRELCKGALSGAALITTDREGAIRSLLSELVANPTGSMRRLIAGNYELVTEITGEGGTVTFSGREDWPIEAALEISDNTVHLVRRESGQRMLLKEHIGNGGSPWKVRLIKQGNFFRFWVNDISGWIREPLGAWETDSPTHHCEPLPSYLGVKSIAGTVGSFDVTPLRWLPFPAEPVMRRGPDDTFKEGQVLVGAIVECQGTYYHYFTGSRFGCQEGGGAREIGVAHSKDLLNWIVEPEPILRIGAKDSWEPTGIYCSGAVITPEGRIAVMYAAQNFPLWGGFGIALAENPLGPFKKFEGNPVYKHFTHAHEFDLVRTDEPGRRYLMFYSGFTPKPPGGPAGDRGYILYSNDLIHWEPHDGNPVFGPETSDNWDAIHVRPRSLNKIADSWYLWYEGCNQWRPPTLKADGTKPPEWADTVGLARSKDLVHWEYYPYNPALPGTGISKTRFDCSWVGWPRMVIRNGIGYVYYTSGSGIGLRTIAIKDLVSWRPVVPGK
jgi:hypothetical protein